MTLTAREIRTARTTSGSWTQPAQPLTTAIPRAQTGSTSSAIASTTSAGRRRLRIRWQLTHANNRPLLDPSLGSGAAVARLRDRRQFRSFARDVADDRSVIPPA